MSVAALTLLSLGLGPPVKYQHAVRNTDGRDHLSFGEPFIWWNGDGEGLQATRGVEEAAG